MRQKDLAILPPALALRRGTKTAGPMVQIESIRQQLNIAVNPLSEQGLAFANHEQQVGGLVTRQHPASGIHGQNLRRAAFHQNPQLLFHLAPQVPLAVQPAEVLHHKFPVPNQRRHKQSRARVCQNREDEAHQRLQVRAREIEQRAQKRTEKRQRDRLRRRERERRQHHGQNVKNAQGRASSDIPISQSNRHNCGRGCAQHFDFAGFQKIGNHSFKISWFSEVPTYLSAKSRLYPKKRLTTLDVQSSNGSTVLSPLTHIVRDLSPGRWTFLSVEKAGKTKELN